MAALGWERTTWLLQMGKYSTGSSNKIRGKHQPEQMASMAGFTVLQIFGRSSRVVDRVLGWSARKFGDEQCQMQMMMGEYEI